MPFPVRESSVHKHVKKWWFVFRLRSRQSRMFYLWTLASRTDPPNTPIVPSRCCTCRSTERIRRLWILEERQRHKSPKKTSRTKNQVRVLASISLKQQLTLLTLYLLQISAPRELRQRDIRRTDSGRNRHAPALTSETRRILDIITNISSFSEKKFHYSWPSIKNMNIWDS